MSSEFEIKIDDFADSTPNIKLGLVERIERLYKDVSHRNDILSVARLFLPNGEAPINIYDKVWNRTIAMRPCTGDLATYREITSRNTYQLPEDIKLNLTRFNHPLGVIDLGGNIGIASISLYLQLKDLALSGPIISVEPEQTNFELLKRNTQDFAIAINAAVNYRNHGMKIIGSGGKRTALYIAVENGSDGIAGLTMNNIINRSKLNNYILIVKCDIEGGEVSLIEHGDPRWMGHTGLLFIESHETLGYDFTKCHNILLNKGFILHKDYKGANSGDRLYTKPYLYEL